MKYQTFCMDRNCQFKAVAQKYSCKGNQHEVMDDWAGPSVRWRPNCIFNRLLSVSPAGCYVTICMWNLVRSQSWTRIGWLKLKMDMGSRWWFWNANHSAAFIIIYIIRWYPPLTKTCKNRQTINYSLNYICLKSEGWSGRTGTHWILDSIYRPYPPPHIIPFSNGKTQVHGHAQFLV